jgi:glucokinase
MEYYLGIDVGGTNIKIGLVNQKGEIVEELHTPTAGLREGGAFLEKFMDTIEESLIGYDSITKIGVGIPGMLSKNRTTALIVPAIPELDNVNLKEALQARFPGKTFYLENDANAAALGEMYFSGEEISDDFVFITLGTGVGGAAIIDKKIFKGGGNAMEVGHVLSWNGKRLEQIIGKHGMLDLARKEFEAWQGETALNAQLINSSQRLIRAAADGDALALEIFNKVGRILAEAMVGVIRILDLKTVLIGGGLSACFDYIVDEMMRVFKENLPEYYTDQMVFKRARLGNQAGLVGVAALGFKEYAENQVINA